MITSSYNNKNFHFDHLVVIKLNLINYNKLLISNNELELFQKAKNQRFESFFIFFLMFLKNN